MQDGLLQPHLPDTPGELEMAAGVGRDEGVGPGGPDMGELPFEESAARIELLEGE